MVLQHVPGVIPTSWPTRLVLLLVVAGGLMAFLYRPPSVALERLEPLAMLPEGARVGGFVEDAVNTPVKASRLGVSAWGSFVDDGGWVGEMVTPWFRAHRPFSIWVAGYPNVAGNELKLEFRDLHGLNSFQPVRAEPGERWQEVRIDLPEGRPQDVRIVARDASLGMNGWLGVSDPFSRSDSDIQDWIGASVRRMSRSADSYRDPIMAVLFLFALWLVAQYVVPSRSGVSQSSVLTWVCSWPTYAVLVAATFVAYRWPYSIDREINPDESTEIAEALKLFVDPRYWTSVDGHTHGPLVNVPLMAPALVGMDISYANARWIAVAMWVCICVVVPLSLAEAVGPRIARIAAFPLVVGMASATGYDYVAYNGEHVVLVMLTLASYAAVRGLRPGSGLAWMASAGAILGAVPYAKLQGTPLAAGAALILVVVLVSREPGPLMVRVRCRRLAVLCIAGLVPSALAVSLLAISGGLGRFWQSYLVWNLAYADRGPMELGQAILWVIREGCAVPAIVPLTVQAAISLALLAIAGRRCPVNRAIWLALVACSIMFLLGLYSAARPGNGFHHYILLALAPWMCIVIIIAAALISRGGVLGRAAIAVVLLVALVPALQVASARPWIAAGRDARDDRVARVISQHASFPQTMVVWGWMPRYHVLTGLVPAVRHNVFAKELEYFVPDEGKRFYRAFIEEFGASPPDVFVDAVAPGSFAFESRARHGYEAFPELAALIRDGYVLVDEVSGIRIFVRRAAVRE